MFRHGEDHPVTTVAPVKLSDLDEMLVDRIVESAYPEVVRVRVVPTADNPENHTRLQIDFADGSSAYVMVVQVTGSGVDRHARYEIPRAVL